MHQIHPIKAVFFFPYRPPSPAGGGQFMLAVVILFFRVKWSTSSRTVSE